MVEALVSADGCSYRVSLSDPADYIQSSLVRDGVPYELEMLRDIVSRNVGRVIDIGANIGNHTLFLAASGCSVDAFEPDLALCHHIEASARLNAFESVTVHPVALGDAEGWGSLLTVDPANIGMQQVVVGAGDVPVVPLDSFALTGVGTIKVDVEGMELPVLAGAKQTIARERPLLYVEAVGEQYPLLAALLEGWQYRRVAKFNVTPTYLFAPKER